MSLSRELMNKSVRRNNEYKDVVNILVFGTTDANDPSSKSLKIFNDIKDLIVFSAMVGKKYEITQDVVSNDSTGITLGTFGGSGSSKGSRMDQHNIIFMFALLIHEDMNFIRDENVNEAISLFEKYSNGGLSKIKSWLIDSAWNSMTLLDRITDELSSSSIASPRVLDNPF